jgi:hypothetical protein
VAVVSKGDQDLVQLDSVEGWHFPRTADGRYAGHHPADPADAIAHLEQLRAEGAGYFVLPSTYFWWLEYYDGLAQHLESRYRLVADCPDTCLIYDLRGGPGAGRSHVSARRAERERSDGAAAQHSLVPAIRTLLDSLLPDREPVLVVSDGDGEFVRLGRAAVHFPHDAQGGHLSLGSIGQREVTAQLTAARAGGIRYLVLPATVGREVEDIELLRAPLDEGREVAARTNVCAIYELPE